MLAKLVNFATEDKPRWKRPQDNNLNNNLHYFIWFYLI